MMTELTLQESSQPMSQPQSDIEETDGELLPGEAGANTKCTALLNEQPRGKNPQPKEQLHKAGLG